MGTIIGSLLGAGAIVLVGRWLKGRDFLGLAAAFFFLALILGMLITPAMFMAEVQLQAEQDGEPTPSGVWTATAAVVTFLIAFIPGAFFVLLAKSEKPPKAG